MSKTKLVIGGFAVGALLAGVLAAAKNEDVKKNVKKYTVENDKLKASLSKGKAVSKDTYLTGKEKIKKVAKGVKESRNNGEAKQTGSVEHPHGPVPGGTSSRSAVRPGVEPLPVPNGVSSVAGPNLRPNVDKKKDEK